MNTLSASPDLALLSTLAVGDPAAVDAGSVVVALAATSEGSKGWIKIMPRGRVTTRDGRSYAFDPEMLAARFAKDEVRVPVDFEHGTVHLASKGQKSDAIGWIEEVEARPDGLWGRVDWLDAGRAALTARTHRYVSPSFPHDSAGNATWLHSVSLVTAPALANMPALAGATLSTSEEASMTKKIAAALGLAETADEPAMLAAISKLKDGTATVPTAIRNALGLDDSADEPATLSAIATLQKSEGETVPKAVHEQAMANLSAAQGRLDKIEGERRDEKVEALLEGALKDTRITPGEKEHYAKLCASDDGFEQVKALLAATPKRFTGSLLDDVPVPAGQVQIDPAALGARARKIQDDTGNDYQSCFAQAQTELQEGKK
ncbi:phage protease [Notoacmeibacter ruber]|nr:phage protease [Notoacmeibacter ruber]